MRQRPPDLERTWHVFARGARRLALFYEESDYRNFLMFLQEALILSGCALFGYVLMGNHYHLILRGTQAQLTTCMKRLNWRYALYHNDTHRMGGHVFDGKYQRYPQRSLMSVLWRLAYVFLNPVQAGLAGRAEDYPWSGYNSFWGEPGSSLELTPFPEMRELGRSRQEAKESFQRLMREVEEWGGSRHEGAPKAAEIQAEQFAWICRQAQERSRRVGDVDWETLALWWGREMGVPPRVMVNALGLPSRHEIRNRVRRLEERLANDQDLSRRLAL